MITLITANGENVIFKKESLFIADGLFKYVGYNESWKYTELFSLESDFIQQSEELKQNARVMYPEEFI